MLAVGWATSEDIFSARSTGRSVGVATFFEDPAGSGLLGAGIDASRRQKDTSCIQVTVRVDK
jgi:hypothetical protein